MNVRAKCPWPLVSRVKVIIVEEVIIVILLAKVHALTSTMVVGAAPCISGKPESLVNQHRGELVFSLLVMGLPSEDELTRVLGWAKPRLDRALGAKSGSARVLRAPFVLGLGACHNRRNPGTGDCRLLDGSFLKLDMELVELGIALRSF